MDIGKQVLHLKEALCAYVTLSPAMVTWIWILHVNHKSVISKPLECTLTYSSIWMVFICMDFPPLPVDGSSHWWAGETGTFSLPVNITAVSTERLSFTKRKLKLMFNDAPTECTFNLWWLFLMAGMSMTITIIRMRRKTLSGMVRYWALLYKWIQLG